jgi:hypothetical protein
MNEHKFSRVCVYFYSRATKVNELLARKCRGGGSCGSAILLKNHFFPQLERVKPTNAIRGEAEIGFGQIYMQIVLLGVR